MKNILCLFFILFSRIAVFPQEIIKITPKMKNSIKINKVKIFSGDNISLDALSNSKIILKAIELDKISSPQYNFIAKDNWLLIEVELSGFTFESREIIFNFRNTGSAREIFWDNEIIWNKEHEDSHSESSGHNSGISIPRNKIDNGYHRLAIKLEKKQGNLIYLPKGIEAAFSEFFIERMIQRNFINIFLMAIFFTSGVFYIVLFFGFNRKAAYLIFSFYCFLNSYGIFENPPWMILNSNGIAEHSGVSFAYIVFVISCFILIAYLLIKYSFNKTNKIFSVIAASAPVIFILLNGLQYVAAIYSVAVIINCYALYKKEEGVYYIFTGLAGFIILFYLQINDFLWNGYFFGGIFFILSVSILSSREIAAQFKKHRQAVLRTSRLENELLKKNIHPHFIMNTLMSLQEVVEQNPEKASSFIQALADEFQMFSKISGEKLVSVEDEFMLCLTHLKIMEFRKEAKYEFITVGFDGTEKIPPGIFHTLIENGTTHGYINKKAGIFSITKKSLPAWKISRN